MKRILLLATTTGYQTRMFSDAADKLGIEIVYATDRCDQLEDPWRDHAIAVRFHEEWRSADTVLKALAARPVDGVIAVGDRPTVLAGHITTLLGIAGHPARASLLARDKRLMREHLRSAGLLVPAFLTVPAASDPSALVSRVSFPCVVKPTVLSGSRGVIRANEAVSFVTAFNRVRQLLHSPDVREMRDPEADIIQIETFIPGQEFALEGVLEHGHLRTLAVFDKPDPLDGPFFEETIYVTPSRAPIATGQEIRRVVSEASKALGLVHGPIHAECRVNDEGVYLLEIAARPIGGLCAEALRFVHANGDRAGLEELLLRHAMGEALTAWTREPQASAVMMIPIPKAGVYRRVDGVEEAKALPGVRDVVITAKTDQRLVPLPEGSSYLGFIFSGGHTPAEAELAVREAHGKLRFTIDREVTLVGK
jgi:biotin carboxylase